MVCLPLVGPSWVVIGGDVLSRQVGYWKLIVAEISLRVRNS